MGMEAKNEWGIRGTANEITVYLMHPVGGFKPQLESLLALVFSDLLYFDLEHRPRSVVTTVLIPLTVAIVRPVLRARELKVGIPNIWKSKTIPGHCDKVV